ncbi:MAG: hypothetical protein HY540_02845 [Deltaproteobacteria bacterium]|nr:hypothetical protein [Deltaproteobacteria bacterium]
MRTETFATTPITESQTTTITVANPSESAAQRLLIAGFDPATNSAGHFRIDSIMVGNQSVANKDIIIPPQSVLTLRVTYEPVNLETTLANYGGWVTGVPSRWEPRVIEPEPSTAIEKKETEAIHRALLQLIYDEPKPGMLYVQLVGRAVPGPEGEIVAGGRPGECTPGDGDACYTGGFSLDIPQLVPGGPKDLVMDGAVRISISGGAATMRMDDFPPALMYLRSTDIPQLPSGVSATLIVSGAQGKVATGTFDGSRLELSDVAFRIRVVLGEVAPADVTPGMSAIVDIVIDKLKLSTIEPYSGGEIGLHLETTLSAAPTGNELFDQYLGGAKVFVTMRGQLAF